MLSMGTHLARYVAFAVHPRGGGEAQGVRSNCVRHCHRPWPFPSPSRQTPRIIAVSALRNGGRRRVGRSACGRGRAADGAFFRFVRSSVPSFLAAPPPPPPPQIQMKCLGMRQSITQSTPSPHEVHSLAPRGRRREEGAIPELEVARARGRRRDGGERQRSQEEYGATVELIPESPQCSANSAQLVNSFDGWLRRRHRGMKKRSEPVR